MGVFGGSVALYHFPRINPKILNPVPLPDFGYDMIPYFCPLFYGTNIQSAVLLILYVMISIGALFKKNNQGRLMIQQLLHLSSILFLLRTTTVGITGLPQPNPSCLDVQSEALTYVESIQHVMLRGFPPKACGDLIFSGHVACTLMSIVILYKYRFMDSIISCAAIFSLGLACVYSVISCRSHYSVDAVLAIYFVFFVQYWYYSISDSICTHHYVKGKNVTRATRLIAWLEDKSIKDYMDKDFTDSSSNGSIDSIAEKIFV